MDRMETKDRRDEIRKKVTETNDDRTEDDLVTIQQAIENGAGEVAHHTKAERTFF